MNGLRSTLTVILVAIIGVPAVGQDTERPQHIHTVAILPFLERGGNTKGMGNQVSDLLFANLVTKPEIVLVEREQLNDVITEQALNVSGLVDSATQTTIGQLTGAKILVAGTVLQVNEATYLVAKIIGTETSRVLGSSVKGKRNDALDDLAEQLAKEVGNTITTRSSELVAKHVPRDQRLAKLKDQLGDRKRPRIFIAVSERHIAQESSDPAAQTEFMLICKELGFEVIDPDRGERGDADVLLTGEGFSELATRHGDLTSVKARVEVKAVERQSRKVLHVDRQTTVAADLGEQIAAKKALQHAALDLAERVLPKIVQP